MKTEKKTITPAMAAKMLERNVENRPLSQRHVTFLAAEMKSGRWKFNGDTICFSGDRLIDGQHRLWAVMESGVSIEALVVDGLDDGCFMTKDIGKRRSANDMLHNAGYKHVYGLSSATMLLNRYLTGRTGSRAPIANGELLDTLAEHPELEEILLALPKRTLVSKPVLAVFRYLTGKVDDAASEQFVEKLLSGVGIVKNEPVGVLHGYFLNQQMRAHRQSGPALHLAVCIKAWNATRLGRKVEQLHFRSQENYPVIEGLAAKTKKRAS